MWRLKRAVRARCGRGVSSARRRWSFQKMMDLILLAIGLGFFALSVGYAYACDRL